MRDVATLAGVGVKTVSRVINNEPNVSAVTAEKVSRAARALNYQLDVYAGNLRRTDRSTGTIGLLVASVANPFSGAIHRAIEDEVHERGFSVFSASLDDDAERERRLVDQFLRRRVDGLILTTITTSQAYLLAEREHGTPFVFVDREPRGIDADAVVSANRTGAATGTEQLLRHGHRRIAYLGDRPEILTAGHRRNGFLDAVARRGIPTDDLWMVERLADEESARRATLALLDLADGPTALFTAQNLITIGAMRALHERDLQNEVALVGFDDVILGDVIRPGLSCVTQDADQIGRLGAQRLLARIDGESCPPERLEVPTGFIARGSGEIGPRA
jgi:LacI family transcriptional regulator